MALQVWLPLRGDVHNQGLYPLEFSNSNATVGTDGCLGSCYSFAATTGTGISANIASNDFLTKFIDNHSFSMCCFFKTTATAATVPISITYGVRIFVGVNNYFNLYNTSRSISVYGSPATNDGKWHHVCATYDVDSGLMSIYIDGELKGTNTYTAGAKYVHSWNNSFYVGRNPNDSQTTPAYFYQGSINDVRFYDHCLSSKEVKEISKGLVVHLKLNESLGLVNMVGDCGYGVYNNYGTGMTVTSEVLYETYKGEPVVRYTYTAKNDSCVSGFKSNYHSRGVYETKSIYIGASGSSKQFVYWIYYRPHTSGLTAGGVASNIGGWTEIAREYMGDGWWRVGQSRTVNNHATRTSDYIHTSLNWPYAGIGSACTVDWGPDYLVSGSTSIIENFADGNNVAHDCSGYGNDGTAYNRPTPSGGAPRYDVSTWFSGNRYVALGRNGMITGAITVSVWGYMSSWSSYSGRLVSCTESGGWNFEPASSKMQFSVGTGVSSCTYKVVQSTKTLANLGSGWHHFVGTYDGLNVKIYIDGVLEGSLAAYTTATPIFYNASNGIFVGAEAGGNQTTPAGNYYSGAISDFRIYGSALSAEDVEELYHTAASVDNHGNFFCGELKEV